jgi:pilus assembly protein Flp/PilA
MIRLLARYGRCERGTTAIEYGMIAAVMLIILAGSAGSLKSTLQATYTKLNTSIQTAN